jgi:hypothetical protein
MLGKMNFGKYHTVQVAETTAKPDNKAFLVLFQVIFGKK